MEPDPLLGSQEETQMKQMETTHEIIPPEGGKSRKAGRTAKKCELCPADPVCPVATCPEGWLGYLGKCYYFSEVEANWTSSQSNCAAFNTSLAVIDSVREMDFVMRYRGSDGYWIGLHREPGQPWKWTNGTEFNNWSTILGREECAFISHDIVSSSCSRKGCWICSK
ncbi:early activation antigen CD69-like isoform X3 [Emydura macquarii macquarii]|uniref:early activation antigen CD69-like isoform X3 n=1 Tax=Emydura macquarii macquarii TaxID=1129001 RepID=UPI00352A9EC9